MSISDDVQHSVLRDSTLASAFPSTFLWGAATSSYQVEGAVHEDGRTPSIWDVFSATPGKTSQGDTGDVAADHYHRMLHDVELMAQLGLGAYRFSVSWSRVLPEGRGPVNARGLDFYDRLVDALLAKGIHPLVTLYHWDLPVALYNQGGWLNRDTAYAFADYAEIMASRLGDRVDAWITHNEPWCAAYLGYGMGIHAPGLKDMQSAANVGHHLLLSHGLALPHLRKHMKANAQVGISLNFTPAYPADNRPETAQVVDRLNVVSNRWFVEPLYKGRYPGHLFEAMGVQPPAVQDGDMAIISTPIDFLGVNNYTRLVATSNPAKPDGVEFVAHVSGSNYTEMDWEIYPQAFGDLLLWLHDEYGVPSLLITENGAAFADVVESNGEINDVARIKYLQDYIGEVGRALRHGVTVQGYCVWSLLDNFEWAEGYSKRFGLVYVDYATQQRTIKQSGHWYASLIANHKQR